MRKILTSEKIQELTGSKHFRTVVIVVGIIAGLALMCNILPPNPIWGPRILKSSPVDISVLDPLADFPVYDVDELRARIRMIDDVAGDEWVFRFESYGLADNCLNHVRASIDVYETSEEAIDWFQWERERTPHSSGIQFRRVTVSDSIDVTLWPIFWERSADALYMYSGSKFLYTDVRINNVRIRISESLNGSNLDSMGSLTNEALQQIVDAFKAADIQSDND